MGLMLFSKGIADPHSGLDPNDGSSGAPNATIQYPTLLDSYTFSPSSTRKVAGAHYAVGYPTGTTLKHPSSGTLPSGVSRNAGSHIFTITGDDVVLDAWDFSDDGGWQVTTNNTAMRPTISNCKFAVGANGLMPIDLQGFVSTGADCTIINNVIDGGGNAFALDVTVRVSRFGTHVIKYNWIKNCNSDHLHLGADTIAGGHTTTYDVRFNLLEDAGRSTDVGAHADWTQTFASGNYGDFQYNYNTIIQTTVNPGGVQGILLQGNGNTPLATFSGGSCSNNTFVTAIGGGGGGMNCGIAYALSQLTGTWLIQNNYADPSAVSPTTDFIRADGTGGSHSGSATVTGNINMTNGAALS